MDKKRREESEGRLERKRSSKLQGGTLKAPVKSGDNPRRASFLARMGECEDRKGLKGKTNKTSSQPKERGEHQAKPTQNERQQQSHEEIKPRKRKDNIMPMGKGTYGSKKRKTTSEEEWFDCKAEDSS